MEKSSITFNAFTSDNKKYEINIYKEEEELIIKAEYKNENEFFPNNYSNNYTLNMLKNNKIFSLFENLTEIIEAISNFIFENKNINRNAKIIEDTNEIILLIPINIGKYKEIIFSLLENLKDSSEKLIVLLKEYKKIKEEKNVLENENKNLNEKLKKKIMKILLLFLKKYLNLKIYLQIFLMKLKKIMIL